MKSRILFAFYWALSLPQLLLGASPSGFVIEWGWDPGYATAIVPKVVCSNAVAISAGTFHNLALRSDNTVYAWGGDVSGAESSSARSEAIKTSGTVKLKGQILTNVIGVSAARDFSLALKKDGTVVTWRDSYVPTDLSNVVSIATAGPYSFALRRDGTVVEWKSFPASGGHLNISELTNIAAIAVGETYHGTLNLALKQNGTVINWGSKTAGNSAIPPVGLSNVIQIAVGDMHSLALKSDGTVVGWGWNKTGQATGTPTSNSPDGFDCFSAGPVRIEGQILTNVVTIAAGRGYSMALKKDGNVVAWGRMVNDLYPVKVTEGLSNVIAIAAGYSSCLAITTNAAVAERFRR